MVDLIQDFSGAEVKNLINQAAIHALKKN